MPSRGRKRLIQEIRAAVVRFIRRKLAAAGESFVRVLGVATVGVLVACNFQDGPASEAVSVVVIAGASALFLMVRMLMPQPEMPG